MKPAHVLVAALILLLLWQRRGQAGAQASSPDGRAAILPALFDPDWTADSRSRVRADGTYPPGEEWRYSM